MTKKHIIAKVAWVASLNQTGSTHLITYAGSFTIDEIVQGARTAYPNRILRISLNTGEVVSVLEDGSYKIKGNKSLTNVSWNHTAPIHSVPYWQQTEAARWLEVETQRAEMVKTKSTTGAVSRDEHKRLRELVKQYANRTLAPIVRQHLTDEQRR